MDLNVAGQDISLPSQARYERTLYVTYLDDELMIARDETGTPDVLMRRSATPSGGPADASPPSEVQEPEIVEPASNGEGDKDDGDSGSSAPDYTW